MPGFGLIVFCARCALDASIRNTCARFSPNAQYMRKICARLYLFPQCARLIVLISEMRKICARLYLFLQCAIYAQDLCRIVLIFQCAIYAQDCTQYMRKIVLISPMRNICARFAQDCTYFPNVQYLHKGLAKP